VALDLHDEAYYGRTTIRTIPIAGCAGAKRARDDAVYRCATAYVMHHDVRFTLAVEFVRPAKT